MLNDLLLIKVPPPEIILLCIVKPLPSRLLAIEVLVLMVRFPLISKLPFTVPLQFPEMVVLLLLIVSEAPFEILKIPVRKVFVPDRFRLPSVTSISPSFVK